jgi:hypothetical protein
MKKPFKIILIAFLAATIAVGPLAQPRTVHAQIAVEDVLGFPAHLANYLKDYVLNTLTNLFIKQLAHQITLSIINWINGGFQGSPAFVQNPEGFFQGIGDNIAGNFIGGPGSPLAALCSPIALNVRLALAFDRADLSNNYACTLSQVISNVKGASINGFTAGDFNQGGWKAFAALAEPQNSFNGAYLQGKATLALQIQNKTVLNQSLLDQGGGFLSWQSCTPTPTVQGGTQATQAPFLAAQQPSSITGALSQGGGLASVNIPKAPAGSVGTVRTDPGGNNQNCQTETPGSFISQQLNFAANSPLQQLDVQDNINAIVGALMSQLVNKALSAGLGAVSGSHSGDSNSYTSQILQQEQAQSNQTAASLGQNYASGISPLISNEQKAKTFVDSSLSFASSTNSNYQAVLSYCTAVGDTSVANQLTAAINTTVGPLFLNLKTEDTSTTAKYNTMLSEQTSASTANSTTQLETSVGGLNVQSFVNGNFESTQQDLSNAQDENNQVSSQTQALEKTAQDNLQQCETYAVGIGNTTPVPVLP